MGQANSQTAEDVAGEVLGLFDARGSAWYGGEAVSQLEHALQAATFAERELAAPELIVAALLHDVGHVLHDLPEDAAQQGVDDRHEALAAAWLTQRFAAAVVEPVELHVAAKQYLCSVDAEYAAKLSPASQLSLKVQGGPMTADEANEFERNTHFDAAIRLRKWDDAAKVVDMQTPTLDHFLGYIRQVALVQA